MIKHFFDSLIIGSGGSSLGLAFYLLKQNPSHRICIATLGDVDNNNTVLAQGGICGVDEAMTPGDNIEYHIYDTIKGGDWLGDHDSIELMSKNSGSVIKDLISIGVDFDKDFCGNLLRKKYGGHTKNFGKELGRRVFSYKDKTGGHIHDALVKQVRGKVELLENHFALKLIFEESAFESSKSCNFDSDRSKFDNFGFGKSQQESKQYSVFESSNNNKLNITRSCIGCMFLDPNGELKKIFASNTIICTGGYSGIFKTSTSNIALGSANLLIMLEDLPLQDIEFVQFHPTGFLNGDLISEAARSIGARLLNTRYERFMTKYAPNTLELASRDIVSRAIVSEMRNCDSEFVFLDLRHINIDEIRQGLPHFYENCKKLGINPSIDLIQIRPSAHYSMGGIPTNKFGQVVDFSYSKSYCNSSNDYNDYNHEDNEDNEDESVVVVISGLYAIGEAASSSVHGANRLGCNSLLELLTSAKIASEKILENKIDIDSKIDKYNSNKFDDYKLDFALIGDDLASKIKNQIRATNDEFAGIIRDEKTLIIGLEKIKEIQKFIHSLESKRYDKNDFSEKEKITKERIVKEKIKERDEKERQEIINYFQIKAMLYTSIVLYSCAIKRRESRGAHYRIDYKEKNDDYRFHSIFKYSSNKYLKKKLRKIDYYENKFPVSKRLY